MTKWFMFVCFSALDKVVSVVAQQIRDQIIIFPKNPVEIRVVFSFHTLSLRRKVVPNLVWAGFGRPLGNFFPLSEKIFLSSQN